MRRPSKAPPIWRFGVIGSNGTGKTTFIEKLATELRKVLPSTVIVLTPNFADPLRDTLDSSWPQPLGPEKVHPMERQVLQATGEMWRNYDRLAWVKSSLVHSENEVHMQMWQEEPLEHEQVIMLYSDVYHINEALTMDQIAFVDWVSDDYPGKYQRALESEYTPVSELQTLWMLANKDEVFAGILDAAGILSTTLRPYAVYALSDPHILNPMKDQILGAISQRRVNGLGLGEIHPQEIQDEGPEELEDLQVPA